MSYNVMLLSEAFERLRKAKALEIEAIELANRAIQNDLDEQNSSKAQAVPDSNSCEGKAQDV